MEMDRARVINNKLPLQIALVQFEAVFFACCDSAGF